jgi:beta-glucosidase
MKYTLVIIIGLLLSLAGISQAIDQKVDSLLNLMTLEEKVGQMTQVERTQLKSIEDLATLGIGSILSGGGSSPSPNTATNWSDMYDEFQSVALQSRLGIPVIYGIDAVHGHNNVYGAVIFPHNIGMGCTWNPSLVKKANQIVAKEVAATGIDWTFSPCIAVPRNERWGRTYEGFGETVEVQKAMAEASVSGLQGEDLSSGETILACAKHFVGDGGTLNGIDQGNTVLSEEELRSLHMDGYREAIDAGVGSVMASYNSWNGKKLHGHDYLLTEVLKKELGFEGFVISDWKGVDQVDENYRTAIRRAINAGIDMVMVPDRYEVFIGHLISLVKENEVSIDRIDDAVRRILKQKFLLGLFEKPFTDRSLAASFGSQAHRSIARQAVRESMVVLNAKNNILPLQKNNQRILVAGSLANDLGAQCGGWTISWQGSNGDITLGTDILTGINNVAGTSEVIYSSNGEFNGEVDVAIVVIGEKIPYAEGQGDRTSLLLDEADINLMKGLKEQGIPTVALLVSGRPMVLGQLLPYTDAMIAVWYPGSEGEGIAEVLFGEYQPSGRLTHSWPKEMAQIPINVGDQGDAPLFEYRHGLQNFPAATSSEKLLPYAASTNHFGNTISLALSDKITNFNAATDDFEIEIGGLARPNLINTVTIADFDESMLVLSLNEAIQQGDQVTLSYSGANIGSSDLVLDSLQDYYVYNAVSSSLITHALPGKVEAEDFFEMKGIQTEACTDIGGGLNVGYIEGGDWMKYIVQVNESGLYDIESRISGYAGGNLLLTFNDSIQTQVSYSATDGWQNWQSFFTSIYLEEGTYTMQAHAQSAAFNINYYTFQLSNATNTQEYALLQDIKVYPNPADNVLSIELSNIRSQMLRITLMDPSGKELRKLYQGEVSAGVNIFTFPIERQLPAGVYFIEIKDQRKRYFKKIIKK